MRKKSLFFAGALLCVLIAGAWGFYWYQKPRQNIEKAKPDFIISAEKLYEAFQNNEQQANKQYTGNIVQVNGKVDDIQQTDSTVSILISSGHDMGGVNCSMVKGKNGVLQLPSKGNHLQIKGRCVGFLMDVNLVDAVIEP